MKPKHWSRPASIAFSLLFIAIMCFTLLPSPVQIGPLSFGGAGVASAATGNFTATKDARFEQSGGDVNYGAETTMVLRNSASYNQRAVLEFDISSIPAGSTISSAIMYLNYEAYYAPTGDPVGHTVRAYKLTRTNWTEGSGGSTNVSWNHYTGTTHWTTGGGDYDSDGTPAYADSTFPASYGWMAWTITEITQDAFANVAGLVEIEIIDIDGTGHIPYFYSKDNATLKPYLAVTYTLPCLTVATLAATDITATSVTLNGNVTSLGSYGNVTQYGFVLSTTPIADSPGNVSPSAQTTYTAGNWTWTGVQYAVGQTFNSNGNVTGLSSGTWLLFQSSRLQLLWLGIWR